MNSEAGLTSRELHVALDSVRAAAEVIRSFYDRVQLCVRS
jgi:hypothetical protein